MNMQDLDKVMRAAQKRGEGIRLYRDFLLRSGADVKMGPDDIVREESRLRAEGYIKAKDDASWARGVALGSLRAKRAPRVTPSDQYVHTMFRKQGEPVKTYVSLTDKMSVEEMDRLERLRQSLPGGYEFTDIELKKLSEITLFKQEIINYCEGHLDLDDVRENLVRVFNKAMNRRDILSIIANHVSPLRFLEAGLLPLAVSVRQAKDDTKTGSDPVHAFFDSFKRAETQAEAVENWEVLERVMGTLAEEEIAKVGDKLTATLSFVRPPDYDSIEAFMWLMPEADIDRGMKRSGPQWVAREPMSVKKAAIDAALKNKFIDDDDKKRLRLIFS